ncbi:MAG: hypothetical protein PHH05_07605 [Syntrophaceticus sp.]|nr:hypothetical protein [Syntrophaceticus sp.]
MLLSIFCIFCVLLKTGVLMARGIGSEWKALLLFLPVAAAATKMVAV